MSEEEKIIYSDNLGEKKKQQGHYFLIYGTGGLRISCIVGNEPCYNIILELLISYLFAALPLYFCAMGQMFQQQKRTNHIFYRTNALCLHRSVCTFSE